VNYCSNCGTSVLFTPAGKWPQTCGRCQTVFYNNPKPVAIVIQPVGSSGVLLVRRGIEPKVGELCLPGGYIDHGETWQEGAVRELREETGVEVKADDLVLISVNSSSDRSNMLICCAAPNVRAHQLEMFEPNSEVTELVVTKNPIELAFPTHTQMLAYALARIEWGTFK